MRHLGDEELATLDCQRVHEEMAIIVHQFETKIAPPYFEEVVVEERFGGHLVVELPVVEGPQSNKWKAGVGRKRHEGGGYAPCGKTLTERKTGTHSRAA